QQQGPVEVDALGDAGLVARRARSHAGTVWITRSVPHSDAPGSARLTVAIVPPGSGRAPMALSVAPCFGGTRGAPSRPCRQSRHPGCRPASSGVLAYSHHGPSFASRETRQSEIA